MKNNSTVQVSAIFLLIILLALLMTSCDVTEEKYVTSKYSYEPGDTIYYPFKK